MDSPPSGTLSRKTRKTTKPSQDDALAMLLTAMREIAAGPERIGAARIGRKFSTSAPDRMAVSAGKDARDMARTALALADRGDLVRAVSFAILALWDAGEARGLMLARARWRAMPLGQVERLLEIAQADAEIGPAEAERVAGGRKERENALAKLTHAGIDLLPWRCGDEVLPPRRPRPRRKQGRPKG